MFKKFLIRFAAFCVFSTLFFTIFFAYVGIVQYFTMIKRVDCQVMAAFESAVRSTQSSVHDDTSAYTPGQTIQEQNRDYYNFYYNDLMVLTRSSEFNDYLSELDSNGNFDEAVTLLEDTDTQKLIGLVPMDLALPYVNLQLTSSGALGLNTIMENTLKQTLQKSADDFNLVNVDINSVVVTYDTNFDSQSECLNFTTSESDIKAKLGPVYLNSDHDTDVAQIVQNGTVIPYYDLKVNVSFDVAMNIPVLSNVSANNRLTQTNNFNKDYTLRYSLLN
jgi:hypothetical protein